MTTPVPAPNAVAAQGTGSPFPDDLVLTPVSRRPTRLEERTLGAILEREVPAFGFASRQSPEAGIAVATRNNLPFLRLCLESVLAATDAPFEVIVVDNGSTDGTREYLELLAERNPNVCPVRNESNRGFATACNQGVERITADVLVLLNDDTAVTDGWLGRLTAHLSGSRIGMVGPVTGRIGNEAQIDADYRTWRELVQFADDRALHYAGEAFEIPMLTMFCVVMRRTTFERIGPLDERFEIGMLEDDDYSRRAREAGFRLLCAEDAYVHHFGETSFGRLVADGEYARLLERNKGRFEQKWGEPWTPYGRRQSEAYVKSSDNLRSAVDRIAPPGASVLVVSRGDADLLRLGGRKGRHFPGEADGAYSGHHPADSREAVERLEREREAGAEFIALPATAGWWLEHYDGFREHLEATYRACSSESDDCFIFDLRDGLS